VELCGVANPNQTVIDWMTKIGVENPYEINAVKNDELDDEATIKTGEIQMPNQLPYINDELSYPVIEAESAIVINQDDGTILWEKNALEERAMASTTKLMTAMVAMEELALDDIVTIAYDDTLIEPNVMGLVEGEQISVKALIQGLLVGSNNVAALALARAGGLGNPNKFIELMNAKATKLGLNNTHFANSHGLDAENHYSTARDLALLAKFAMNNDFVTETVAKQNLIVYSDDGSIAHNLKTTNELLGSYLDIRGGKTGFTDNAGQVFISSAANDDGNEIITVVMNSPDRFQETKSMIDWTFGNFYWD
jgi:D-alanyl-D-alanine carboxypeptidase (penicillin-binding protein 5/6)